MNTQIWDAVARPPASALKQIRGGRLQGMTDVNPQWRYRAMTEVFGPCGVGWKYEIARTWTEPGTDGQVLAFAEVRLYTIGSDAQWNEPIPGIGGSMLIAKERDGLRANDEAFKMSVTDALSVAMKMLGVAADIYAGLWDGSKYKDGNGNGVRMPSRASQRAAASPPAAALEGEAPVVEPESPPPPDDDLEQALEQSVEQQAGYIDESQRRALFAAMREGGHTKEDVGLWLKRRGIHSSKQVPARSFKAIRERLADKTPLSADA